MSEVPSAGTLHDMLIILMGVSGSGKTTLGTGIATEWGLPFFEGDKFHRPANVENMAAGIPLQDEDRWPWLNALGAAVRARQPGIGCERYWVIPHCLFGCMFLPTFSLLYRRPGIAHPVPDRDIRRDDRLRDEY